MENSPSDSPAVSDSAKLPAIPGAGASMVPKTDRRPRSLRVQFAIGIAIFGVVLAAVLSASLGAMVVVGSRHDAAMRLQSAATMGAQLLSEGIFARLRETVVLANSSSLWADGLATPQVEQALLRSQAMSVGGVWIGAVDLSGRVCAATGKNFVGPPLQEREWFVAGLQDQFVSDVHSQRLVKDELPPTVDGAPPRFVDFSAPIRVSNKVVGVLAIHTNWDWTSVTIGSLMPVTQQQSGLEVFVFDRHGKMIHAPAKTLAAHWAAGQKLPVVPRSSEVLVGQHDARIVTWLDGVDYLTTAVRMDARSTHADVGWIVVARQPLSLADSAARRGSALALGLGLFGALVTAALGWWLASRLAKPLRSMAADASGVGAHGVLSHMHAYGGSLEVEQLSMALNGMISRLAQANAELEDRVRSRTAELEKANDELDRLARFDALTSLLNRRGFDERAMSAVASAKRRKAPLSVLILDADHFKRVNDTYGHEVGDEVLKTIAGVFRRRLREVDFVARVGGEEFVVVLSDTGSEGACRVANDLLRAVETTAVPLVGSITVSCGVAELAVGTELLDSALRRADEALYRAKQEGRNRFCLSEEAPVTVASYTGKDSSQAH